MRASQGTEVYHRCVPVQHENMTTRIVLLVVFGLLMTAPASAAVGPEQRGWTEEDRALAASDKPGSLARPLALSAQMLDSLCKDLRPPPTELEAPEPQAARRVFTVSVPTAGLRWNSSDSSITLDTQRPLNALDGWLRLQVLESGTARFPAKGEAQKQLKARLRGPGAILIVSFVVADAREINPCFGITGSENYTIAAVPLQWTLRAGNTELGTVRAPAYDTYAQWAYPGEAKLRLRSSAPPGTVDPKALQAAVGRARRTFERCANKVMATEAGTFVVGLAATLTSDARLVNVRTEISSADGLGPCFRRALKTVRPPRPYRTAEIRVVVEVSRDG